MAKKKQRKFNMNSAVRSAIRRIFSRSPIVREVLNKVRRERTWFKKDGSQASKPRVEYLCSQCSEWHMGHNIQVDHEVPVVSPTVGFVDWNTFVERLFCDVSNLSVLCKTCHKSKTDQEKKIAAERRRTLKNK